MIFILDFRLKILVSYHKHSKYRQHKKYSRFVIKIHSIHNKINRKYRCFQLMVGFYLNNQQFYSILHRKE